MAKASKTKLHLVGTEPAPPPVEKPVRQNRVNLFDLAYEKLEDLIVSCTLKPGQLVTIQELQTLTGLGRTPIHQAVNRLAGDTLIIIRPRHGLQIAPVDLARERTLLRLRRDVERFVVGLATERARPAHRSQLMHIARNLRARDRGTQRGLQWAYDAAEQLERSLGVDMRVTPEARWGVFDVEERKWCPRFGSESQMSAHAARLNASLRPDGGAAYRYQPLPLPVPVRTKSGA